jgi:hypothetical protein
VYGSAGWQRRRPGAADRWSFTGNSTPVLRCRAIESEEPSGREGSANHQSLPRAARSGALRSGGAARRLATSADRKERRIQVRPTATDASRLADSPTRSLADSSTRQLANSPTRQLANSPTRRLADSNTRDADMPMHASTKHQSLPRAARSGALRSSSAARRLATSADRKERRFQVRPTTADASRLAASQPRSLAASQTPQLANSPTRQLANSPTRRLADSNTRDADMPMHASTKHQALPRTARSGALRSGGAARRLATSADREERRFQVGGHTSRWPPYRE